MVTVSEASSIIQEVLFRPSVVTVDIADSVGRVLAEEVYADRDLPPFNRATMDGIAIAFSSFAQGRREFQVKGTLPAGVAPFTIENPTQCIEIMTGAVVPDATDTVVRYEDIRVENGKAIISVEDITKGQNIHRQGADAINNALLLQPSQKISPAEIALLASIGRRNIKVFQPPRIGVVSTGDELVPVDATPKPWQVRVSNAYAVAAALTEIGMRSSLFHLSDDEKSINDGIKSVLDAHDVIILSGGVSKGKFDHVPSALSKQGIEKRFHEISQRPGKPMWFGLGKGKTVFALPGNPVSTFMCFHRYVKPWLEASMSLPYKQHNAVLAKDYSFKPALTYFLQVSITNSGGSLMATPDSGGGSGDFANLRNVDGFLELPLERNEFRAGDVFPYYPFRR